MPAAADVEQLVGRAAGDEGRLDRLARTGKAVVVEERLQTLDVDEAACAGLVVDDRIIVGDGIGGHWLATSCSRCSANFWRAAASFSGRCSLGHAPGAAE